MRSFFPNIANSKSNSKNKNSYHKNDQNKLYQIPIAPPSSPTSTRSSFTALSSSPMSNTPINFSVSPIITPRSERNSKDGNPITQISHISYSAPTLSSIVRLKLEYANHLAHDMSYYSNMEEEDNPVDLRDNYRHNLGNYFSTHMNSTVMDQDMTPTSAECLYAPPTSPIYPTSNQTIENLNDMENMNNTNNMSNDNNSTMSLLNSTNLKHISRKLAPLSIPISPVRTRSPLHSNLTSYSTSHSTSSTSHLGSTLTSLSVDRLDMYRVRSVSSPNDVLRRDGIRENRERHQSLSERNSLSMPSPMSLPPLPPILPNNSDSMLFTDKPSSTDSDTKTMLSNVMLFHAIASKLSNQVLESPDSMSMSLFRQSSSMTENKNNDHDNYGDHNDNHNDNEDEDDPDDTSSMITGVEKEEEVEERMMINYNGHDYHNKKPPTTPVFSIDYSNNHGNTNSTQDAKVERQKMRNDGNGNHHNHNQKNKIMRDKNSSYRDKF